MQKIWHPKRDHQSSLFDFPGFEAGDKDLETDGLKKFHSFLGTLKIARK